MWNWIGGANAFEHGSAIVEIHELNHRSDLDQAACGDRLQAFAFPARIRLPRLVSAIDFEVFLPVRDRSLAGARTDARVDARADGVLPSPSAAAAAWRSKRRRLSRSMFSKPGPRGESSRSSGVQLMEVPPETFRALG